MQRNRGDDEAERLQAASWAMVEAVLWHVPPGRQDEARDAAMSVGLGVLHGTYGNGQSVG